MEALSLLGCSSSTSYSTPPSSSSSSSYSVKSHLSFSFSNSIAATTNRYFLPKFPRLLFSCLRLVPNRILTATSLLRPSALVIDDEAVENSIAPSSSSSPSSSSRDALPKIDKSGRFCSPRAARELALSVLYASCLEGSDPVRLFEKRINARKEPGYEFHKETLIEYNHMSFGGPPVTTDTIEEADELINNDLKESEIEAEVLSAPPKLVYSKLILRFTRKLLVAVAEKWDDHVRVIDKVVPHNWKNEPAGRILELSILHLAMSEIAVLGTRHQIVINEAVDLAKRFCDGAAHRIINGCLRTFVKDFKASGETRDAANQKSSG